MICIKNGTVYNAVTPEGVVADILVENGKIKEVGNHQELLERKGLYEHLYHIQFLEKMEEK